LLGKAAAIRTRIRIGPNIAPNVLKASDIWVGKIMSRTMPIIINKPRFLRVFFKYSILISDLFP
jgi:hypothetical protein